MRGRNVETKAQSRDLEQVAATCARAGAAFDAVLEQTDTYFAVGEGRLKLREIVSHRPDGSRTHGAELIRYTRPDDTGARLSRYDRVPVADAQACRASLEREHGIRAVVRKARALWLLGSTRIHLDQVDGLGTFVELETVVGDGTLGDAEAEHERLLGVLGIEQRDTIAVSYVDLQARSTGKEDA